MQNRKKLNASFKRIFRKNADYQEKQLFARWFSGLDISNGQIFSNRQEELDMQHKMEQQLHNHFFAAKQQTLIKKIPAWFPLTAAAILTIVAGTIWLTNAPQKTQQLILQETITRVAERKIITLADGSVIILNNDSKLKYPKVFNDTLREVYLEGEAFFEVAKNKLKPFVVKTGKLSVKVLGTSFNIKHYKADENINVVVATGKVGVKAAGNQNTWLLTPGNQLLYNKLTTNVVQNLVDPSDYTAWKRSELIFKDERLEDICKRLERWYDVKITIRTAHLKNKRISLKQKNESLSTVLKMLGIVGNFQHQIKGRTVEIW